MLKHVKKLGIRVLAFGMATFMTITPAFALNREVQVFGAKSINDMGNSDQRINMDLLKDDYSDFVQTDTLREYFHQDKDAPQKVDLDMALSWLIDNNIISRDVSILVTNVGSNKIPGVSITKFDMTQLNAMEVMRTDMLMYVYKAAFGPINARSIAVETDNIRVDDGQYITLRDLMIKNGYTLNPSNTLPGSGTITIPGNHGAQGGQGGGPGSPGGAGGDAEGSNHETNYINDFSNWRYQPQGDLWESIFGDTNIFISQNNFNQTIEGGDGGPGGNGGNASTIMGGTAIGGGGGGGGSTNTGDNIIDYDTDYKQIYFIPGADLLFYDMSEVPEVYIQAALSKGILEFDSALRTDEFNKTFVQWPAANPGKIRSWDRSSPAFVVNRSRNVLKTVSNTEQVPLQTLLGKHWNVSWQNGTLTITRNSPFANRSGYFTTESVSKMDVYRYIYHFIVSNEKVLSDLERDIVNYKYGMELDGITSPEDTNIIKYLIAKGIINYDITTEFMNLASPISWSEFITLLYRTANEDARLDFSKVQLTDSETQWKAAGYAPQTRHIVKGDDMSELTVMTLAEYAENDFGTQDSSIIDVPLNNASDSSFLQVASQSQDDGRQFVQFGAASYDKNVIVQHTTFGQPLTYGITPAFSGAIYNSRNTKDKPEPISGKSDNEVASYIGLNKVPSTPLGMYTMYRLYELATSTIDVISADFTGQYDPANPGHMLHRDVACNLWAITAMLENHDLLVDVNGVILQAQMSATSTNVQANLGDKASAYKKAVDEIYRLFNKNAVLDSSKIKTYNFLFSDSISDVATSDWVSYCNGDITKLVDRIVGLELFFVGEDGTTRRLVYRTTRLSDGATRSGGSARTAVDMGNSLPLDVAEMLIGDNWSEAQKAAKAAEYANNVTTFANLESISNTTGLLSYVDPDTAECFVAWSTIERYQQSCTSADKKVPITKISDMVLYNEVTQTYAYFSNENERKIALVGNDVVNGDSEKGVVYREGTEVYYHIDALRLLMNAKQEAAVLGGVRAMPLASQVIQDNLRDIPLDLNNGVDTQALVGITVLLSDDDATTSAKLKNSPATENSVYFTNTPANNMRWGDFIAVSQANRAINVVSRQFSYSTEAGKQIAYAVVVFEPQAPSDIESVLVNPTSSLQDLLDAPMKAPETEEGKAKWQNNYTLCNAFANWIYGTSGHEYISTGYLEPHAYIYAGDKAVVGAMSQNDWKPLTEKQQELVEVVELKNISIGAVCKYGTTTASFTSSVRESPEHRATYMLSTDYRVCVMGNRLYMNLGCFDQLSSYGVGNNKKIRVTGVTLGTAAFTVGSTFKIQNYTSGKVGGYDVPIATVVKTSNDGTVLCQVGPVVGVPLIYQGTEKAVIRNYSDKVSSALSLGNYNWSSKEDNLLVYMYETLFAQGAYRDIKYEGIAQSPYLTPDSSRRYVFDGASLHAMSGDARTTQKSTNGAASLYVDSLMSSSSSMSGLLSGLNAKSNIRNMGNGSITSGNVETYFLIEFNAFNYTIKNGTLTYSPNQASDYISPSLFTSLNDLIINDMINADNGAIPVEEIPFGSILEIGTGYYVATGTSAADLSFIGYAPIEITGSEMSQATLQNVAKSYAGHFIRAGNQQLNVSHFFNSISVLSRSDATGDPSKASLSIVEDNMLSKNTMSKTAVYANGGSLASLSSAPISTNAGAAYTLYYAPTQITFQSGLLMAYVCSAQDAAVPIYRLAPNANSAVTGPLSKLPFYSENALSGGLADRTAGMLTGGFTQFYGAPKLLQQVQADFQKAFAGDLFTLARMIIFIVLIWLVVASWMCYATYFGGLMPILDAIRYPTGSRQGKGIDLMKIVSLGSISMETDFKLGRFLQYNVVLAALLCVVWLTGSITI